MKFVETLDWFAVELDQYVTDAQSRFIGRTVFLY